MSKLMKPCDLFPMIGQDEYEALKLDIQEHGQREPILLVDGEIIDGRNRLRACNELGIDPIYRQLTAAEAGDVFALVMSLNFHRRHLKPHEKGAALAAFMERVGAKKWNSKDMLLSNQTLKVAAAALIAEAMRDDQQLPFTHQFSRMMSLCVAGRSDEVK